MTQTSLESSDEQVLAVPYLLELKGIDAYYGSAQALNNVSLRVKEGEIVCLLGGNASGKSTTMKIILGLLQPRAGEVLLAGKSIARLQTADIIRRGVASFPEARRVFADMTIEENLRVGAHIRSDNAGIKQDIQRMFELFPRLAERRRQRAGTLSGGEQQMLAFARALMSHPRLICMDEPTMGLAPIFVERVLETISEINRTGVIVFMVEQNAELALSIAAYGYVLQSGLLALEGPANDLLPNAMQRTRPDGHTLTWSTLSPGPTWGQPWPFLIQWNIPDEQRLQIDRPGIHPNGAIGWVRVAIATRDLNSTLDVYQNQLGLELVDRAEATWQVATRVTFSIGKGSIDILAPNGDGPVQQILAEKGEGPYALTFTVRNLRQTQAFLEQKGIKFAHEAVGTGKLVLDPSEALGVSISLVE